MRTEHNVGELAINENPANNIKIAKGQGLPNTAFMVSQHKHGKIMEHFTKKLFQLAAMHNQYNSIVASQNTIMVTSTGMLQPGQPLPLTLTARQKDNKTMPLLGCMIYAEDAQGNRIGSFTDKGKAFVPFPACGVNPQGQMVGMVHQEPIAEDTGVYTNLVWNAPTTLPPGSKVMLKGLAADELGYGFWGTVFTVGQIGGGPLVPLAPAAAPMPSASAAAPMEKPPVASPSPSASASGGASSVPVASPSAFGGAPNEPAPAASSSAHAPAMTSSLASASSAPAMPSSASASSSLASSASAMPSSSDAHAKASLVELIYVTYTAGRRR
jgi:hypothetical protein